MGFVMDRLDAAAGAAVSLAIRRSSTIRGRKPAWLQAAGRVALSGFERDGDDAAYLHFIAPRLKDAAADLYCQPSLFGDELPEGDETAFDVLGDIIHDVEDRDMSNDEIDLPMLRRFAAFGKALDRGIEAVELELKDRPSVDRGLVEISKELSHQTPPNRRVRVTGRLDMLCDSDSLFRLILPNDEIVRGIWMPGDVPRLGPMLREDVVVDGMAVFRPSGQLLRIDADAMEPATAADHFFSRLPKPGRLVGRSIVDEVSQRQTSTSGIAALYGQWPGDETEEELLAALEEIRHK